MNASLHNLLSDKARIEVILDFLPYPFIISERQGNRQANVYLNKKFLEEIGYTLEEIPDIDSWFVKAYPDPLYRGAISSGWNDLIKDALGKGEADALMRVIIRTKNHGDKWYEVKSRVTGSLQFVAFVNLTEVMLKEHELQRLNENKNQTLSILAHDVRGPLTNLNTMTRLMLEGNFDYDEFLHRLQAVHEKSSHVLEFIDNTLLWTRANFNAMSIKIDEVNVEEILEKILLVYSNVYQAKGITIRQHSTSTKIKSDAEVLTIIIRNLFSNAIKFCRDNGEISIRLNTAASGFSITIEDNGVGMSPDTLDKIQREHHTTTVGTREEKGLGLGLRLCRQLARKLNGEIHIQSKQGVGTEVTIHFQNQNS